MLNDALQTIGLLGGIAGAVLVAGPTPLQRAAGFGLRTNLKELRVSKLALEG